MTLKQKLAIGLVAFGLGTSAYFAKPSFRAQNILQPTPAYAQQSGKYSKTTNPLAADAAIKNIAKKAKSASALESAKKLHSLLRVGTPGGLKISDVARSDTADDPPKTAAQTLKEGGDCSEFAYVVISALNEIGIKSGIIILDLGKRLLHVIAYVEIDGQKLLVDPQLNEFNKGGAQMGGKMVTFTYEQAKKLKRPKFIRDVPFEKAHGAWHYESGSYLDGKGDLRGAHTAYGEAYRIDADDFLALKKFNYFSAIFFNPLMKKAAAAFNSKDWKRAAVLSEEALVFIPPSMGTAGKAKLHANIGSCRFNSGEYAKAAEHFEKAFKLSGDEQYKKLAEQAKKLAEEAKAKPKE